MRQKNKNHREKKSPSLKDLKGFCTEIRRAELRVLDAKRVFEYKNNNDSYFLRFTRMPLALGAEKSFQTIAIDETRENRANYFINKCVTTSI